MALKKCSECGGNVSDKAVSCPHCGNPMNLPSAVKTSSYAPKTRRKYHRLPNGFGNIKKLSGHRRNPYAVYPPIKDYDDNGNAVKRTAIGYFPDYMSAFDALQEYNKNPYDIDAQRLTFAEVFEMFYTDKFSDKKKNYADSTKRGLRSGFKHLKPLHNKPIREIKSEEMQAVIDACDLKHATVETAVNALKQTCKFACKRDIINKDYSAYVKIKIPDDDESGVPFSEEELKKIFKHKDDTRFHPLFILLYSGMRIGELEDLEVDLTNMVFCGGLKTPAGKNRVVPIHKEIVPYLDSLKNFKAQKYRESVFYKIMDELGISISVENTVHTPHDTRHTFSWIWDKCIKPSDDIAKHMIMGHSLGNDVEKSVYAHRTVEELKELMLRIKY